MPQELVVEAPGRIGYVAYTDREPVGSEVLVRTRISGIGSRLCGFFFLGS